MVNRREQDYKLKLAVVGYPRSLGMREAEAGGSLSYVVKLCVKEKRGGRIIWEG